LAAFGRSVEKWSNNWLQIRSKTIRADRHYCPFACDKNYGIQRIMKPYRLSQSCIGHLALCRALQFSEKIRRRFLHGYLVIGFSEPMPMLQNMNWQTNSELFGTAWL
jgi:hypothetical protein